MYELATLWLDPVRSGDVVSSAAIAVTPQTPARGMAGHLFSRVCIKEQFFSNLFRKLATRLN